MAVLLMMVNDKPLIVPYDPLPETQQDVEAKHGVTFSTYYETRESAERSIPKAEWVDSGLPKP